MGFKVYLKGTRYFISCKPIRRIEDKKVIKILIIILKHFNASKCELIILMH